ncbi:unnamed protein product [Sphagnum troendelagicum]
MVMAMPCKPHVAAWMALHGACGVYGNVEMAERIANKFLNWSLKMLLLMCYSQTSMLLLAAGISLRMLSGRERKKV